jgi:hypothetical protein
VHGHRSFLCAASLLAALAAAAAAAAVAAERPCGCTDDAPCQACVPACKGSWEEKKTKKTVYSMKCEYACARGYDCWCSESPECRCSPPCGKVFVKKKIYRADGEEKVEKAPRYEVTMVPEEPCDCARCCGVCWWNPLSILHYVFSH